MFRIICATTHHVRNLHEDYMNTYIYNATASDLLDNLPPFQRLEFFAMRPATVQNSSLTLQHPEDIESHTGI